MTPVTVDSSALVAGGSGNTVWSAKGTFQRPTRAIGVPIDMVASVSTSGFGTTSTPKIGQSFTPDHDMSVTSVTTIISKSGAPTDDVTVEIRSDASNTPGGTVLGTSAAINGATMTTTTPDWENVREFTFSTPVSLTASTKYWLTFQRSGSADNTNSFQIATGFLLGYAGGDLAQYNGTSWTRDTSRDMRVHVIEEVTGDQPLYQVTQDTALHIWKSTDSGATWTEQDSTHAPSVNSSTASWSADMSAWGELAVAYFSGANTVRVRVFDTRTDTWATTDLAGANATTDADPISSLRMGFTDSSYGALVAYTSIADTADISCARRGGNTWGVTSILAVTSTERSLVTDVATARGQPNGVKHLVYYETENDDLSYRSATIASSGTTFLSAEADLDTTAAASEAKHAAGAFQPYDDGSGHLTSLIAYIDSDDSLQERSAQLSTTSRTLTPGTQHQVSSSTSYAGRQLSTCKYGSDLYVFASTGTGIDYYVDAGATGTWSSVTNWKTGLTSGALSQALSVPGVGILVSYMDNGNVVIDWAVGGPSGAVGDTGTVSAGSATASGLTVSATAGVGVTGSVSVGTATASGLTVTATGGVAASATVSAGTATASGLAVNATAGTGVTGSVTAGTATASGLAVAATTGTNGVVTVGTATAAGLSVTALAGVGITGIVTAGMATASGLTVSAVAGIAASGTVTAGSATADGTTVTASAASGETGTVSAGTATASGLTVSATGGVSATGSVTTGDAAASGLSVTATTGTSGSVTTGTAAASGLTVNALAGSASVATVTAGDGTATGTLVIGTGGVAASGSVTTGTVVASGWLVTGGAGYTATIEPATIIADGGVVTVLMLPTGRISATLSHTAALSASVDHHEALDATLDHRSALSARLEHV